MAQHPLDDEGKLADQGIDRVVEVSDFTIGFILTPAIYCPAWRSEKCIGCRWWAEYQPIDPSEKTIRLSEWAKGDAKLFHKALEASHNLLANGSSRMRSINRQPVH